jgi:MFS family permease
VANRYGAVLSVAGAPRLLASSVLARMPLGMSSLAILLLVRQHTGSFGAAGFIVGVFAISQALASPVLGALVDRWGQRRVLLPSAAAQSALLVVMVVAAEAEVPLGLLAVLAAVAGALLPPVGACMRVLWADIVPDPAEREAAYSLDAVTQETIWTVGPLAVGATVALVSPAAAVLGIAAVTLAGTLAFATAPLPSRRRGSPGARAPGQALRRAGLRSILVTATLMGVGIGAVEVGLPALAFHTGSPGSAGVILAVWSIGSLAGGLAYGARTWTRPPAERYPRLLAMIAVVTAPLLLARSVEVAVALSFFAGLGFAPTMACQMGLVGMLAPEGTVTEAFTWSTAAIGGGIALGAAVSGSLVEAVGVVAPFVLGCAGAATAAAIAFSDRARFARRARAHPLESPAGD